MNGITLNTAQLADIMGVKKGTLEQYLKINPQKIPPRLDTGIRGNLWSVEAVKAWMLAKEEKAFAKLQEKRKQLELPIAPVDNAPAPAEPVVTEPTVNDFEIEGLSLTA